MAAANPKSLLLIVGGGLAVAEASISVGGEIVAGAVFVALAALLVVILVGLYRYLGIRIQRSLDALGFYETRGPCGHVASRSVSQKRSALGPTS
jgi:hypothetical protein